MTSMVNKNPNSPPVTDESLLVDSREFDAMVDRSAGGPAYREVISQQRYILLGIVGIVVISALAVILFVGRINSVVGRLDSQATTAETQRLLLVEQQKILLECTTPTPLPGEPIAKGDDGKHECYESGQARTGQAVGDIIRAQIAIAQCAAIKAPDMTACVQIRLKPAT